MQGWTLAMSVDLLDSNVWVALSMERHTRHREAAAWFDAITDSDAACFCRMTQNSFMRLVTVKEFLKEDTMTNAQAVATYRRFRADPRCGWLDEPEGLESKWLSWAQRDTASPKVWMDAYLAAFALQAKVRLVTLDAYFKKYQEQGLELLLLGTSASSAK